MQVVILHQKEILAELEFLELLEQVVAEQVELVDQIVELE
jgi:hypothetical protein